MTTTTGTTTSDTALGLRRGGFDRALPRRLLRPADIERAAHRLRGAIEETPCSPLSIPGSPGGVRLYAKRDYLQKTGSFKERGAANALLGLSPSDRKRGVVAASAGNHALGLAWHGARLEVPVTLVMPRNAARVKVLRCRRLGAGVVLFGNSFDETEAHARRLADVKGARFVHPFDDPDVIAGQGTMGLEILRQVPDLDAVVVPVGGGGLLAGLIAAIKLRHPGVGVFAVEPAAAASFAAAMRRGRPERVSVVDTLADGLAVGQVGGLGFATSKGAVDGTAAVSEVEIAAAMRRLFEAEGTRVEGAGAVSLAAVLAGKFPALAGRKVVVPLCGSNVDPLTFARALEMA